MSSWSDGNQINTDGSVVGRLGLKPASYTIWINGTDYEAVDAYGKVAYGGSADAGGVDGADAAAVIQAAADALTSGGKIYCRAGTYTISTGITITNDNVVLEGEGAGTWEADGVTIFSMGAAITMVKFDGTSTADMLKSGVVRNISFVDASRTYAGKGIHAQYVCAMVIEGCTFYGIDGEAIDAETAWGITVDLCNFQDCGGTTAGTIYFHKGDVGASAKNTGVRVTRCIFEADIYASLYSSGTAATEAANITHNFFEGSTAYPSSAQISGVFPYANIAHNLFVMNTLSGSTYAVNITGYAPVIASNYVNGYYYGISHQDRYVDIHDNYVVDCTQWGIYKVGNYNGSVHHNTVVTCGGGALLGGIVAGGYTYVTDNTVIDCDNTAICLSNATYCVVMQNTVRNVDTTDVDYGIRESGTCNYNVIKDNAIRDAATAKITLTGSSSLPIYNATYVIEHHTAADTLTLDESNTVHTNLGATGNIKLTLPQNAVAGTTFEFAVMTAAQQLQVDAGAAGAIYIGGAKSADDAYIWADDEGESVKLVADGNGDWVALYTQGTWTVV